MIREGNDYVVGMFAEFCRELLCPMLKKVFGDLDCVSPEVRPYKK